MIELSDVYKSFGPQRVLDGVNLRVPTGTTFVLLGASGSGKTVLLKLVAGLLRPDRGSVRVDGEELTRMNDRELQSFWRRVGIVFQAGALFDSISVFENLALPLHERLHLSQKEIARRIREVLELLDLSGVQDKTPGELSGGMRKRVAFARAIILKPPILLFDEPTAGLDPLTTKSVSEEILIARRELHSTILAITHDLPTAFRVADTIALLHEGKVIGAGTPQEFEQNPHPAIQRFLHTWHTHVEQAGA